MARHFVSEKDAPRPFAVTCCGCGRVLMEDGTLGQQILSGGAINLTLCAKLEGSPMTFATRAEVDVEVPKHGWKVIDGNHRCPNCTYEAGYKGMYIDRSILGVGE